MFKFAEERKRERIQPTERERVNLFLVLANYHPSPHYAYKNIFVHIFFAFFEGGSNNTFLL